MASKLTPAVGYVRMSSGKQEASPAQQRAEIKKLAERDGYKILRWYTDEGISGDATEKRKEFQRMTADAQELGDFSAVLVWDQDRFGRFDIIEAGRWIYPIRKAGVWLVSCSQGVIDWNDIMGQLVYSVQQMGKHSFLLDLSRNVLRGKLAAAKQGKGASAVPYGYDRQFYDAAGAPVKLVPFGQKFSKPKDWTCRFVASQNAEAPATVQWMFQTFADSDCGQGWLAAELNRRGVASSTGKKWSVNAVRRILTRQAYVGTLVWGAKRAGKYHHTGPDGEIERGDGHNKMGPPPIVVEDVHDRLVDPALFARVQAKIASRQQTGRAPRFSRYLLSGVARCGHCGQPLGGKAATGRDYRYYVCSLGMRSPGACHRYQVRQAELDEYILGVVEKVLFADDVVERIRLSIYRQAKSRAGHKAKTAGLQNKIIALDAKIAKGTENLLLADPANIPEMSIMLAGWKDERDNLQAELEAAAVNPGGLTPEKLAEKAIGELQNLRRLFHEENPAAVRTVIKALVEEVRIWWEPYGKRSHRMVYGVLTYKGSVFDIALHTLKRASHNLQHRFTRQDVYGVSIADRVLDQLRAMQNGHPVTANAIAMKLGARHNSVSEALAGMVKAGYTQREQQGWIALPKIGGQGVL